ncbi:hypothetical protein E1B28_001094 [Marasmius oreades]|uniref:Protein CPL1-like domain-containing protein n=1 Tax=Marasmius oreades TaxID=181124 RepID=A0A9P7V2V9_9AGAR|nr:uncharacterized protein E1B28_001094 [Marasmius oreades]KAG7099228.1 hypothetical protein E1B28_001094 [Marasmius oreades]
MTVFTRLLIIPVILTSIVLSVDAQSSGSKENCASNEFWYAAKETCLPYGGPTNATITSPPKNRSCPPSGFYWAKGLGCCVPTQPISNTPNTPPPQCEVGSHWYPALHVCLSFTPDRTRTSSPSSHPSGVPSSVPSGYHRSETRHKKRRNLSLCPKGLDACPIPGAIGGGYECLNFLEELESCGGCVSLNQGQDCTAIKGSWSVGCEQGSCVVYNCAPGYTRSPDFTACILT